MRHTRAEDAELLQGMLHDEEGELLEQLEGYRAVVC